MAARVLQFYWPFHFCCLTANCSTWFTMLEICWHSQYCSCQDSIFALLSPESMAQVSVLATLLPNAEVKRHAMTISLIMWLDCWVTGMNECNFCTFSQVALGDIVVAVVEAELPPRSLERNRLGPYVPRSVIRNQISTSKMIHNPADWVLVFQKASLSLQLCFTKECAILVCAHSQILLLPERSFWIPLLFFVP